MNCKWIKPLTLVVATLFLMTILTEDASARHHRHRRGRGCHGGHRAPQCCGSGYSHSYGYGYGYAPAAGKGYGYGYAPATGKGYGYGGYGYGGSASNAAPDGYSPPPPPVNANRAPVNTPSPSDQGFPAPGPGVTDAVPPAPSSQFQATSPRSGTAGQSTIQPRQEVPTSQSLDTGLPAGQARPDTQQNPASSELELPDAPSNPRELPRDDEADPNTDVTTDNSLNDVTPPSSVPNP